MVRNSLSNELWMLAGASIYNLYMPKPGKGWKSCPIVSTGVTCNILSGKTRVSYF